MKNLENRLERLEAKTPDKPVSSGLGAFYTWEQSLEGQAELEALYDPDRTTFQDHSKYVDENGIREEWKKERDEKQKKTMQEYHKDLRERGLL